MVHTCIYQPSNPAQDSLSVLLTLLSSLSCLYRFIILPIQLSSSSVYGMGGGFGNEAGLGLVLGFVGLQVLEAGWAQMRVCRFVQKIPFLGENWARG
ncbi:hypothetical protein EV426DRAFT_601069 [Tirmania nivea]|nr:hypothetical protein EV426DRAFT_601069 [Tirmania nivea]